MKRTIIERRISAESQNLVSWIFWMRARSCCILLLTAWAAGTAIAERLAADQTVLAEQGKTGYVITLAPDASPQEKKAATELADYLKQITGAEFAIVPSGQSQGKPIIAVGPGAAKAVLPKLNLDKAALGDDGIVIKTSSSNLILTGAKGAKRGTLYAVYEFLESVCGVRWWSSRESYVPKMPVLAIGPQDRIYVPKVRYRETWYADAFNGIYAARSKCNGYFENIPPEYGGHYHPIGWCHTFAQLLPPEKYFKDHPDWFSEIKGKRDGSAQSQLCLTNEEMRKELVKNALAAIRKEPEAGMISISQNDGQGFVCQCPKCRAVIDRERAPSGLFVEFVNKVAEDIEKEFPDFLVETLAYGDTQKPPDHAKPRRNVIIRLCAASISYAQPVATGTYAKNEEFRQNIEKWGSISHQIFVWEYLVNYGNYLLPHPNMRVIEPNIRFYVDHKAVGLFEQGDGGSTCGDFLELRTWIISHLMWNPSLDEKALIREFLSGYYGPAAQPLQQYLDLTSDAIERSGRFLLPSTDDLKDTAGWLTLEDLNRAMGLFNEAFEKVKDDSVLKTRVRRARMTLDYACLQRYYTFKRQALRSGKPFLGPSDPAAFCNDYIKAVHEFNNTQYAEGQPFKNIEPGLQARFRTAACLPAKPKECETLAVSDWQDIQDNELFGLASYGAVTIVDDEKASDKKALRLPGGYASGSPRYLAVQYTVSSDSIGNGPWRYYMVARCQLRPGGVKNDAAFMVGIYDGSIPETFVPVMSETLERADGNYHTYDLGVHDIEKHKSIWNNNEFNFYVVPLGKTNNNEAVFIDRLFCIKEEQSQVKPEARRELSLPHLRLPHIFSDHMVLQRGVPVPIWGWADKGEQIMVKLADQTATAKADNDGRWEVVLQKLDLDKPTEMSVTGSSGQTITLKDILVGEVWLASGQSNMAISVGESKDAQQEIAAAHHPKIRLFSVGVKKATEPQSDCLGVWTECSPTAVSGFSAVAYYFGRQLNKELNLPIGVINASNGGTPAEFWTSHETLEASPALKSRAQWPDSSCMYNGMITPLIPYTIRGVIWYQGEANAIGAYNYRTLFPAMISNWRADWMQGDFPFGFVQLPPFRYEGYKPAFWAELREAQLVALKRVPNTGMVVTMDIGDVKNLHPKNKQEVGRRLALWALAKVYGRDIIYSGPIYKTMTVEGNKIRLRFDHVGSGLTSFDGKPLAEFTIAGDDHNFVPAVTEIDGNSIVVHSDQVARPVAVRYAWRDDAQPNLANKEGLPASPFRTDTWKSVTE